MVLGMWDENKGVLTIRRSNGQIIPTHGAQTIVGRSDKVFGVETVGNEVHVLTGPRGNRQPTRRVRFSDSGMYKGSTGI